MRLVHSSSLLAALVAAAPSQKSEPKLGASLDLLLQLSGNSQIQAKLTNLGDKNVRLLKSGTILSDKPTRKASVYAGGKHYPPTRGTSLLDLAHELTCNAI